MREKGGVEGRRRGGWGVANLYIHTHIIIIRTRPRRLFCTRRIVTVYSMDQLLVLLVGWKGD